MKVDRVAYRVKGLRSPLSHGGAHSVHAGLQAPQLEGMCLLFVLCVHIPLSIERKSFAPRKGFWFLLVNMATLTLFYLHQLLDIQSLLDIFL